MASEIRGGDPAVRLTRASERSTTIVADLFKLWETELPRISGSENWRRRSATPRPDARLSGASSSTVVSKSIPTLSNGPSDPK
jgi:hypothetical protein